MQTFWISRGLGSYFGGWNPIGVDRVQGHVVLLLSQALGMVSLKGKEVTLRQTTPSRCRTVGAVQCCVDQEEPQKLASRTPFGGRATLLPTCLFGVPGVGVPAEGGRPGQGPTRLRGDVMLPGYTKQRPSPAAAPLPRRLLGAPREHRRA